MLRVQRLEQGEGAALRGEIFRVLERQVGEAALDGRQQPVELPRDHAARRGERRGIARKRPRRAAKHVARELIEHDDERERSERRLPPALELSARGPLPGGKEPAVDFRIEDLRLPEPGLARPAALGRIRRAEPKIENH